MWNYEKRLEYPINIKRTDAAMAKAIISQFGGPDGETGAAMRYLSQRFAMPYRPVMGILTDVGTEASKYEFVDLVQTKKEILAYPICSIVAVFKMLIRILNTATTEQMGYGIFSFFVYTKSTNYYSNAITAPSYFSSMNFLMSSDLRTFTNALIASLS